METAWGTMRGDQYVARCGVLGIELKGFDSHEAAQEAVERKAAELLREALKALEGK